MESQLASIQQDSMPALTRTDATRLLLVDDHPENLVILQAVLKNQGYEMETALSGIQALELMASNSFDLILLDVMMPEVDGFEVCRRLKDDPETQGIPIIFITAKTDFESVVQGYELGAVDYVTKPFNPAILRVRVKNQLRLRKAEQDLKQTVERLEQEVAYRLDAERALREREKELERFAMLDGLTQIGNRRRFDDYLTFQWANKKRAKQPISMILLDIDFFKQFNDNYGHQAGDAALQGVARSLQRSLKRPEDVACRYGGEEFAIILPNTPMEGAIHLAHRLTGVMEELNIPHEFSSVKPYLTVSMGVSSMIPDDENSSELLIQVSDVRLYEAKDTGRNRYIAETKS